MRIVFICGSLESGRDGVGDYTRQLAFELLQQGHDPAAIALNDHYLTDLSEPALYDSINFQILRLPSSWTDEKRFEHAGKWILSFNPDWISLQFVIYSYHKKGLPFGLPKLMAHLGEGRKWHIMFHEIWIGFTRISPLKHKVTGYFQRQIIKSITKALKADLITTSNILYQLVLKRSGINSTILTLFSNIPYASKSEEINHIIWDHLGIQTEAELKEWELAGIFGNLYPEAELQEVLKKQLLLVQKKKLKFAFISFGRISEQGMAELKRLENFFAGSIKFIYLGEQPAENVSGIMQLLDSGISCTPSQHIGKSGVFAAMKLHGLEVIMSAQEVIPEYESAITDYHTQFVKRKTAEWSVKHIAKQFIELLEKT